MQIREVGKNEKGIIDQVVRIHLDTFEGFFLTFMGKGFLKTMYSSYCAHGESGLLIAMDEEGKTVGFLAYSGNMSGLYKYMIKKKLIPFAWYSLGAFVRKPKVFMRLIRAFLKPSESQRDESYVELASIGVDPSAKSKGIGSQAGWEGFELPAPEVADFNGDGKVNRQDRVYLARALANWENYNLD